MRVSDIDQLEYQQFLLYPGPGHAGFIHLLFDVPINLSIKIGQNAFIFLYQGHCGHMNAEKRRTWRGQPKCTSPEK